MRPKFTNFKFIVLYAMFFTAGSGFFGSFGSYCCGWGHRSVNSLYTVFETTFLNALGGVAIGCLLWLIAVAWKKLRGFFRGATSQPSPPPDTGVAKKR